MKKFIIAFMIVLLSACTLGAANTPKEKVSEFLDRYKNQDKDIISQLEDTIKEEYDNDDYRERYKTLMTNQYKDLEYTITDEIIEEDNAVVEAQITVYDYASAIKNANDYLSSNMSEFAKETTDDKTTEDDDDDTTTTDYDEDKFMDYKLTQMENVNDKVTYTIEFTLTKTNGEWQMDALNNSDIEKLHGIYES